MIKSLKQWLCSTWNMVKNMFKRDDEELFESAFLVLMQHEGGYQNNPSDRGGPTNYGLSQRFLESIQPECKYLPDDVRIRKSFIMHLSKRLAKKIYKKYFWDRYDYDAIGYDLLSIKVFDLSVNMGPYQSHKLLQIALNKLRKEPITIDGIIGPQTLNEIKQHDEMAIIHHYIDEAKHYYINLIADNPEYSIFKHGWLKRAKWPLLHKE